MATTDQVILEFLIKEMGSADAIKSLKGIEKQSKEIIKLAETISAKYGTSMERAVALLQKFSDEENKVAKEVGGPGGFNQKAMDLAKVEALRSDALEKEKAITKEKEKQAKAQANMDAGRVQDIERAQQLAMIENQIFEARKALSRPDVAGQLAGLGGKTPYQQTQTLIPLMTKLSKETGASSDAMLKLVKSMYGIDDSVIRNVTRGIHDMKNGLGDTVKEMFNLKTIMNTAFGVGMAMIIFQLQMLVSKFFTDTIQQVKDLQVAISKLSIVEQMMSQAGIQVTGQDLVNIVDRLKKDFTTISETDLLAATGDMGTRLAEKGITPVELERLMRVALGKQITMPGRELSDIQNLISNYALTGERQSVSSLGISFTEEMVKQEAVRLGLLQDITDELTTEAGVHARISLMYQSYEKSSNKILEQQNNLVNASDKLAASWENLTAQAAGFVNLWNAILYILAVALDGWTAIIGIVQGTTKAITPQQKLLKDIVDFVKEWKDNIYIIAAQWMPGVVIALELALSFSKIIYSVWAGILSIYEKISGRKVSEQPSIENLKKQDTVTGTSLGTSNIPAIDQDKVQKIINDILETLDEFYDRAAKAEEDYQIKSKQEWEDYYDEVFGERTRFIEDWMNDRNKIISDAEEEMAEEIAEHNQDKLDAEAKFQEELRQLREKYLMNLDDALHERDARQILRLAREYAMNKQNMINEYNLKQQQDDTQHQLELAEIAKKRDERLAELDFEMKLRLKRMDEDFALRRKRAEEEHKLEMRRLEHERQDRLRQLRTSLEEQLKLSAAASTQLYRIFEKFFGPGGYINTLMKGSYQNTAQYAAALLAEILKLQAAAAAITSSTPTSFSFNENIAGYTYTPPTTGGTGIPMLYKAKGGLDVVNKPTGMILGDAGPEAALTVLLNQLSSRGGMAGLLGGGDPTRIELDVTLSPDLEARVVKKSVNSVTSAVMNVRRASR